jgi:hypothetical protein
MSSCSYPASDSKLPSSIVGKWEHAGHVYEYKNNGKLLYDGNTLKYEILEDGKIHIIKDKDTGIERSYVFDYSMNSDGTLTVNEVEYFPVA